MVTDVVLFWKQIRFIWKQTQQQETFSELADGEELNVKRMISIRSSSTHVFRLNVPRNVSNQHLY